MALDLGVFGEDCPAMEVILGGDPVDRGWDENWVWIANGGEASQLKSSPITPILSGFKHLNRGERHNIWGTIEQVRGGQPSPHPEVWPPVFWKVHLHAPLSTVFRVLGLEKKREEKKRKERDPSLR